MKSLLTPKNDFVFKKLFSTNLEILTDLINCILKLPEDQRVVSVEVKNPGILPDEIEKKFIILDIRAVDESGREYDIEMQVRKYENYPKRSIYYLCKLYGGQLQSGEDYTELHPVIGVHFLDYEQFPGHPEFHYQFGIADVRYPELSLNEDLYLHIFELPGIERSIDHGEFEKRDRLTDWLYFFNHAHEEGDQAMREHYTNPAIKKAFNSLEALSADEEAREMAERREKALKDEAMFLNEAKKYGYEKGREEGLKNGRKEGIEEGRKEGIEEGKKEGIEEGKKGGIEEGKKKGKLEGKRENQIEVARKLLAAGMEIEKIIDISGLSAAEIKEFMSLDSGSSQEAE